ncbi:hypothetical protein PHYSODRAFT_532690 [Phytophthora sojae]|uniref:SH3 domain-containing protein n=1 Tax=Phytophthora sojae (strain P6497) TaxID=1094619 RepID=G5AFL2_PHYSP|nr:hypothetical protein PHYSODRAFT_532690 [Phytophthora sojae]EGZ06002.1 hypothetical protein PHYSODRAFT_532690 [Phytophthora sojae]|eukprot:XP_009538863.1 hypothetical protein PHYSODRAFT_532690 [Phytophthora sojae]
MLPALTTKPKQAVRQVKGLTNDSIDSYSNTPLGGGSGIGGGLVATYVDNTESGSATARGSPLSTSRSTVNTARTTNGKPANEDGATMARVVRDRKASGEEELSLRTGDIVKVLSSKRTGYLKCEAGDEVGYVPSSYLEFLDSAADADSVNSKDNAADEEAQRAAEKQRRKQKKEKRKKEKREANDASEPEEAAPVTARSPRKEATTNAEDEGNESPRKSSRKKSKKHRQDREAAGDESQRGGAEEPSSSARSRAAPEDTERSRSKSKHSKKKRHRDVDSSESSESDGGKRSGRHGRRRRHRRGSSDSDSESTSSDDSDASYRRRRRRRRHRHRRSSSEEDAEDDSDYKRRSRRSKKRRDKNDNDSEPEEGSRSARKAEKKKQAATLQEVEKGVSQLDMKSDEKAAEAKTTASSKKEEPDRDRGKKDETERSEGSSEGRATNVSSSRKDDEGRTSSTTSSSKQNGSKSTLGRQIGEKMRSFLGGGSKKQHSSKNSSGILNACPGTVQGEEGWYEHGENERYYFVLVDGKWSLLYGPMTEDDFEVFSNRVLEQNRAIELPPTYLHKSGYYLNRELRVQREQ